MDDVGAPMRFLVLGPLDVAGNGQRALGGPKQRAVLGMLVARVGQVVSNDALIDGVWGEQAPASVQSSLHTYVSNLRAALGGVIERAGGGYRLEAEPASVDAVEFEHLVDEATRSLSANPDRASETLRSGLGLWRGKPYADLLGVEGLQAEIRRLEELRLSAVEARIDADLAIGRHQVLSGELMALATEYPLRERFQAQLMVALYRDGRQSEALRAFERTREYLRDELGVDPSPELQELELRILNHDPDLLTIRDAVIEHIAFLFTDIAGSTELWETRAPAMRAALVRHDEILSKAIEHAGGRLFKHTGDGVLAAFPTVFAATRAATEAQGGVGATDWGELDLQVRMALDVGEVDARGGDFFGPPLNRGSRLMSVAHGGQILLSEAAQQALSAEPGVQVRSLGEHRLRGLGAPIRVFQLIVDGLPHQFPELRVDAATAGLARQFGDAIRGYEVRERLCSRQVSVVYRAFQPTVGREVAVKVIRPEYANHPAFVRRFEAEARMVAGLEHPHIVSLYDYWRDADGAYLVMPLMAGGSLADKNLGALSLDRVAGLVGQVGSALGYAHRQGVIHRDIKPSNILLDGDGNAYLSDFGIAVRAVERDAGIQSESAVHRAPEDRAGAAVDERSDIYSLARVVAGLVTGSASQIPDLSALDPPLRNLLESALAEDPSLRPGTVEDFVGRLNALTGGLSATAEPVLSRNPYKGLAPFDVDDARDFFGRDEETLRLVELVGANRIVIVVGPSGSGKSSLVRAGLLPALGRSALAGSDRWLTVTTVPGSHPFDEMASALGEVATESMGDMAAELSVDDTGLVRVAKRIMANLEGELAIVVDQFEELYTVVTSDQVRRRYVRNLIEATADARSRVRVVLTLRADFYDHPLGDELLGPIVSESNLSLAVPKPAQLREAIERPATNAGVVFEEGLTDQLLADVQEQPGSLPLLQYALASLVAQSLDGRVSIADYERLGGVRGALTQRADEVFRTLDPEQRAVAEEIFMRLVSVSEDADDVRRRVRQSELESLGMDPAHVAEVLQRFGGARLLTFDRDPITRGPTVEVAHEALLRHWERFRGWLDARREALILHRRFRAAVAEWEESGGDTAYLLAGGRLSQFEGWADSGGVVLTSDEAEYLENSIAARQEAETRRRRLRRGVLAGFGVAAAIALTLAATALVQRNQAQQQTVLAEASAAEAEAAAAGEEASRLQAEQAAGVARARALAAEAENNLDIDPELAIHLALAALEPLRQADEEDTTQAVNTLRNAIANDRVIFRVPGGNVVAVSPDGRLLATEDVENGEAVGVAVWDIETQQVIHRLETESLGPGLAFAPDGESLLIGHYEGTHAITRWNLTTGQQTPFGPKDTDSAGWFALGPDGLIAFETLNAASDLALELEDVHVEVWSISEETLVSRRPGVAPDLNSDGLLSYATLDGLTVNQVVVVDPRSGETIQSIPHDSDLPFWTSWSPEGSRLAAGTDSGLVVYDATSGIEVGQHPEGRTSDPEWLPSGDSLVVGGEAVPRVIDAATGETEMELLGENGSLAVEVVPGSDKVVIAGRAGEEGEVVVFDTSPLGGSEVAAWTSPFPIGSVGFTSSGEEVVLGGDEGYITAAADDPAGRVVDAGEVTLEIQPGGNFVMYDQANGRNVMRSLETDEVVYRAPVGWNVRGISVDGTKVIMSDAGILQPGRVRVVDVRNESAVDLAVGAIGQGWFSPDAEIAAVGGDPDRVNSFFDTTTGELVAHLGDTRFWGLTGAFTPDGTKALIGGLEGDLFIFDREKLMSGVPPGEALDREVPAHDALILRMKVSPDGTMAATGAWGDPLKVWDITNGRLLGEFGTGVPGDIPFGDFHPTKPQLLVATPPDEVRIYTLDPDELVEIARSKLSRGMTDEECELYFQGPCAGQDR